MVMRRASGIDQKPFEFFGKRCVATRFWIICQGFSALTMRERCPQTVRDATLWQAGLGDRAGHEVPKTCAVKAVPAAVVRINSLRRGCAERVVARSAAAFVAPSWPQVMRTRAAPR